MLGVLPFVEDPDLSVSAARALAQHLPPWFIVIILGNHRKITSEMTFPQVSCAGWRRLWVTYSCPSVTLKHCQQCLQSQIQGRKTITKTQTIIKTKTKCISVLYFCHQLWGCPGARANLHKTTPPTTRGLPHKPGKMPPDTLPSCLLLESQFLCCPQRPVQSHP